MAEYIDLDTPLEVYRLRGNQYEPVSTTLRGLLDFNKIPYTAADVVPVRHGRWNYEEKELRHNVIACFHTCSFCGYHTNLFVIDTISASPYYYCPNCGAKMDGEA